MFPNFDPSFFTGRRGFGPIECGPGGFGPPGRFKEWDFGGKFGFGFGGGEGRSRRGDIKYALLELLAEKPRHGYELIKELENRRSGFRRPSPGSVYPTLQLLEEGGYLTSEPLEGKRVYTITDSGRELLSGRTTTAQTDAPEEDHFDAHEELRSAVFDLGGAVMQAARHGNSQRITRIREVLERARREIYTILAEE